MSMSSLERAFRLAGNSRVIAELCKVSDAAVYRWRRYNRLPQSDLFGATQYAKKIAKLVNNEVTEYELLQQTRTEWEREIKKRSRKKK